MRFNFKLRSRKSILNHEGAEAFRMSAEMELYSAVATTMVADSFYEQDEARLQRIKDLISQVKPEFAGKLAVYARTRMNLRSIPLVLSTELARTCSGNPLVGRTVAAVVQRPDEITEMLACYQAVNGRTGKKKLNRISKQMQKGLAAAFNKFDEYQFAKYDRTAEVKLRDALFLVHPKAKDAAQQKLFDKIACQELAVPYTWETELSALGQQRFASIKERTAAIAVEWEELIDSGRLGYMALLRNLRNMLKANVSPQHVEKVCTRLSDPSAVNRSRQLPFRFLAAYREVLKISSGSAGAVLDALEQALESSLGNLKGFGPETRVVIACDVSASMQQPVSSNSKVLLYDIGLLLGLGLRSRCRNVIFGMFGDRWQRVTMPSKTIMGNVNECYRREGEVGYATNGYLVLQDLITSRYAADKVMLFTDTQLWDGNTGNTSAQHTMSRLWQVYKKIAPAARLYLFDLAGYGKPPLRTEQNGVYLIAGWSDKVFELMEALGNGSSALKEINQIEL